jgi:hypothetical protein
MAVFEQAIFSQLQAVAGITTLVGARCYPIVLPQNVTYPAIRYFPIDEPRTSALNSDSLIWPMVQIDCYAGTVLAVSALADAVIAGLSRVAWTQDGYAVRDAIITRRGYDAEDQTDLKSPIYRYSIDFAMVY